MGIFGGCDFFVWKSYVMFESVGVESVGVEIGM